MITAVGIKKKLNSATKILFTFTLFSNLCFFSFEVVYSFTSSGL